MAEAGIKRIQDLRVGDIFLGPIGGVIGLGVGIGEFIVDGGFRVGRVDVRHAGIVVTARPGTRYGDPDYPNGITDSFELAQAMPSGAEITSMTYERHWTERCLYVRLPEDYPGQAQDAANVARLMVKAGVAYSFGSYASLALHSWTGGWPSLDSWIARRRTEIAPDWPAEWCTPGVMRMGLPVEAICSVFVDQAWTLAGKSVVRGTSEQAVSPSLLARTLIQTEGARLGWPGLYPFTPAL